MASSLTRDARDVEKTSELRFALNDDDVNGTRTPRGNQHHYGSRARERLRHFLHPDGRRIHVAASPEHAIQLRKKLEALQQSKDDEQFDIYVSGSPDHLTALRQAQSHHESRRDVLRTRHSELYDQFFHVHSELDALANELDRVTTHGVSLEAHFSKYGYNAHIKSYDEESPTHSGISTPRSHSLHGGSSAKGGAGTGEGRRDGGGESAAEKGFATRLTLFKAPTVRQYFHQGILWRGSESEEVQSFELFVDLLYVGIIAINGDAAAENPTGFSLLQFVITFTLSWKIWSDMALIISWFETDDIFQRVSIVFLLICLFGYTTNLTMSFEGTYPTLIGFYLAARLYMAAYLALVIFLVPMIRGILVFHIINALIAVALWIGSIHVEYPNQLALIFIALFFDICGNVLYLGVLWSAGRLGERAKNWVEHVFAIYPAINIEHRTERTNAFVTLVFGYTVVAILYQSTVNGIDDFFGKAILGLIQAFCFNWIYFEVDGSNLLTHAIRRHKISALMWTTAHLPFIMAFVLGSGALARLVLVTDTPGSNIEHISEADQARSEAEIRAGSRWFYCAGFGVALACMGFISLSHVHREFEGLRWQKRSRLVVRFAIAIVLICLPLAERLNSLELIGTVTTLVVFVLLVELWYGASCHDALFKRDKPCQYFGRCDKKQLESMIRAGNDVDIVDLMGSRGQGDGVIMGP